MILTLISIFTLIGLLSYYIIFSRIKISSFVEENYIFKEGVSIIICAKNELYNIKTFFPFWIDQDYTNFELIIVNDQSTDASFEYLNRLESEHSNLKVIHISENETKILKGKRHALLYGINEAKNDYLLFTDADCKPHSKHWVTEMTKAFQNPKTEIVLGYSPYKKEKGFLNKLIQFETLLTALQYFGLAQVNMPYMSVGRNVAYKRSLFTENVFQKSNKSISGDDDLIFQQLATKENTVYQISQESITESIPPYSFKEWFFQKKRHLGAGKFYKLKFKFLLGFFILFNLAFYASIIGLILTKMTFYMLVLIGFKILIFSFLFYNNPLFKINNSLNIFQFIGIDIIYWFIYLTFVISLKI